MTVPQSLPKFSRSTVVPAASHFASDIVVSGKNRSYFFHPGSLISQTADFVLIRSYGSLYIFPKGHVTARYLASKTALLTQGLPAESNALLANAVHAAIRTAAYGKTSAQCPDCAFPVAGNFITDSPFGKEPGYRSVPTSRQFNECALTQTCVPIAPKPDTSVPGRNRPPHRPQGPTSGYSSGVCFPSNFVMSSRCTLCISPSRALTNLHAESRPNGVVPDAFLYGYAIGYYYAILQNRTGLYFSNPEYFSNVFYEDYYSDIDGGVGASANVFNTGGWEYWWMIYDRRPRPRRLQS